MADGDNNVLRFSELSLYDNKIKNYADKKINKLAEEIAGMSTYNEIYSEDSLNLGRANESTKGEYSSTLGKDNIANGDYSHAEGIGTSSLNEGSHSEGNHTSAVGSRAHAEGDVTTAYGSSSHAEGFNTYAVGSNSHAEGMRTCAIGYLSHSEGEVCKAIGSSSHAEGSYTTSGYYYTHAEGYTTSAYGYGAHAEGYRTCASQEGAHAEGEQTYAIYSYAHAEGYSTTSGYAAHAEGYNTCANYTSHSEGYGTCADGSTSHAEGYYTYAGSSYSHTEGEYTTSLGTASHAEGYNTYVSGSSSHAEGNYTTTLASCSHVEGSNCYISDSSYDSHAEGYSTTVAGGNAHAEGCETYVSGNNAHSEGNGTYALGSSSHSEGQYTTANGLASHAEGIATIAENGSHSEGCSTTASGIYSHSEGENTYATGRCQHVEGSYNIADPKYLHILGNGNKPIYEYDKNNNYTISNEELDYVYKTHIFKDGTEINWLNISKSNYPIETEWGWDRKDANIVTYNTPVLKTITEQDPFVSEDTEQINYVYNRAYTVDSYYQNDYEYENGDKYVEVSTTYDDNKTVIYRYGLWLLDGDVEYTENSNAHTIDWDGNAWFAGDITDGQGNTLSEVAAAVSGGGGGGGSYTLPTASTSTLGGVKIDNFTTKINNNGVLSTGSEVITVLTMPEPSANYLNKIVHCIGDYGFQNGNYYMCVENTDSNAAQQPYKWVWRGDLYAAPVASDTNIGMVRPDGTTIQITSGGVISASGGGSSNVLSYDETLDVLGLPPNPIYRLREVIPVMTSDTTPRGVASASSFNSSSSIGYEAYRAFDSNRSTRWTSAVNTTDQWIQYKFDNPKVVSKIKILSGAPNIQPTYRDMSFVLQGSNDGALFTDLKTDNILASENLIDKYIFLDNENSYLYYRLQFTGYNVVYSGGNWTCIVEIKMYEKYLA